MVSSVNLKHSIFTFSSKGIALKKVEAKAEAEQENGKGERKINHIWSLSDPLPALGQGMSDVATILARRVAVEFSDSDDCASESEYDSEDWGAYPVLPYFYNYNKLISGETDA